VLEEDEEATVGERADWDGVEDDGAVVEWLSVVVVLCCDEAPRGSELPESAQGSSIVAVCDVACSIGGLRECDAVCSVPESQVKKRWDWILRLARHARGDG
jgi:hypothetical protein